MKRAKKRGAPKGNDNAAKPKKQKRVLIQVRVSAAAAALLKKHTKEHKNAGRALDHAIAKTWDACIHCGEVPTRGGARAGAALCESCFDGP
jgi:hypothetical protein